jgi:hypothetical protein
VQHRILNASLILLSITIMSGSGQADDRAELARLRQDITALVGPAHCANLVNCRVAALGVNACGAAEYIAYSWRSTDKDALDTRIAEYNLLYEDAQKQTGPSTCVELAPPVAACVNGRCVITGKP